MAWRMATYKELFATGLGLSHTARHLNLDSQPIQHRSGSGVRFFFLPLLVSLLLAAVLCHAFLPTLTQTYGYNDDYPLLWRKLHRLFPLWTNEFAQQGRPLGGLIWIGAFSFPRSLEQLAGVRALALLGVWLLACLQCWHLWRWLRFPAGLAAGLSLAAVLSPAFGVLGGWAELWSYPYASVLAYAAGMWTWAWAANTEPQSRRRRWGTHALVGLAVILGHATYQPSTTYFMLAIVAGAFAARGEEPAATWRALWRGTAVFVLWTAVYFAAYKGLLASLGSPRTGATVRAELVSDVGGKLRYLFGPVLWCSLTSWLRLQAFLWQVVAATLVAAGVVGAILFHRTPVSAPDGRERRRFRPDWVLAAAVLTALAIAVSPLAVVKENTVSFRTLPTVFAVLIFSALLGWRAVLGRMLSAPWARVAQGAVLLATVLFLLLATRHHLHHGLTKPNRVELAELRRALHDRFDRAASPPSRIVYVSPSPYIWSSHALRPFAEFGARSSPQPWVTPAMFRLILEERFGGGDETSRTAIFAAPAAADRGEDPVVDGFTLLDGAGATTRDLPRLGEVRILPSGWCVSPWLGAFDAQYYPSIYHPLVGWIYCMPEPTPEIVFAPLVDTVPGWLRTTPERFPECVFLKTGKRARLSLEISPVPRWLDPETGQDTSVP